MMNRVSRRFSKATAMAGACSSCTFSKNTSMNNAFFAGTIAMVSVFVMSVLLVLGLSLLIYVIISLLSILAILVIREFSHSRQRGKQVF